MKKVIFSLLLLLSVTAVIAQKKNVSKARNLALMESPDFKGAREAILPALEEPTTSGDPRTWHVAGLIGYKENETYFKDLALGKQVDFVKKGTAVMESLNYFLKAYELDQNQVDKKGKKVKPKFEADIKAKIKEYFEEKHNLFYYAATLYDEKKDYVGAMKAFETYLEIPNLPFMKDVVKIDSTYIQVKYFNALAARNAEMWDKAIQIHEKIKDEGYETSNIYKMLYEEYVQIKDTTNFLRVLEEGFNKMPEEPWFIQNLINYYLTNNLIKESKIYINKAIEVSPNEAVYYYINAKIYETEKDNVAARKYYDKTLELDPKYADAYAGIGVLVIEEAQKILDDAAYKSDREFNIAKNKANEVFKSAIEYFKKAADINPEEQIYKRNLRMLYYRLGMSKELEAIEKELGY
jgi:tetratricopeptide (TPR) repeat protein